MTIDEAVKRYVDNADIDEAVKRYADNADYECACGNLQGYLEFKRLENWLKELCVYREMYREDMRMMQRKRNLKNNLPN